MKKTPKKILEIATYMRNTGDFSLDIRRTTVRFRRRPPQGAERNRRIS